MTVSFVNHQDAQAENVAGSKTIVSDISIDVLLDQAMQAHRAGYLQSAEALYRKILMTNPTHADANHYLGIILLEAHQIEASLHLFKTALDADPDQRLYWISYVDALIRANHIYDARLTLMQGLELGLHGAEVDALVESIVASQNSTQHKKSAQDMAKINLPLIFTNEEDALNDEAMLVNRKKRYVVPQKIEQAAKLLQAGQFVQALEKYKRLLKTYPKNPHVLTGLGTIALRQNKFTEGIQWLERCLAIDTDFVPALTTLALGYTSIAKYEDAVVLCNHAIALSDADEAAYTNRANALRQLGRIDEAIMDYRKVLQLTPHDADGYFNLGQLFYTLNRYQDALHYFQQAAQKKSGDVEIHRYIGLMLLKLQHYKDAMIAYDQAIAISTNDVDSVYGRGYAHFHLNHFENAEVDFRQVITLKPDMLYARLHLGLLLQKKGLFKEALECFNHVIKIDNAFVDAYNNRALLWVDMHETDQAALDYQIANQLEPDAVDVKWNWALLALQTGDFNLGWQLYEARWDGILKDYKRAFERPLWLGEQSISGKTLLIYPEQGLGDFIQFCRYVPLLKQMGAQLILQAPKPLLRLMACMQDECDVIEDGAAKLPNFDYRCPIMSLPLALKTSLETIPYSDAYLTVNAFITETWKKRLGLKNRPRVGLVWSGSTGHTKDRYRSISLELLAPLFSLPIEFHALQKEFRANDVEILKQHSQVITHEVLLTDFAETAALIAQMDLVISVDTSVAHLAAALGKPCWLLLPYSPDYRWMLDRKDSPWYASMTLFRQSVFDDWQSVIADVKQEMISNLSC